MTVFSANIHKGVPSYPANSESWFVRINCLLLLALTAAFCTLPLILHNSLPQSQDMTYHIFQVGQFNLNLSNGVLYPRWTGGAINGYGSPNFIFYSPLPYYLVAIVHLLIPSLVSSMVAAIWLSFFLSGVTMLSLVNHFTKGRRGLSGLIPAMIYQLLPFHIYEVYLRGSFAALFAYIWFPLILLLMFKILDDRRPAFSMFGLSLAYAALVLTHIASAYMFSLIAVSILTYFLLKKQFSRIVKIASAFGAGLGITSIYFIPAFLERKYVHMDYLINGPWGRYADNYLFTADKLRLDHSQFSHFYVLLHLGAIADLVLFCFVFFAMRKRNGGTPVHPYALFVFLFLLSFYLTIPISKPLAEMLPGLSTLLFPWRWMAIMEVALAFLSGYILLSDRKNGRPPGRLSASLLFFLFIALSGSIMGTTSLFGSEAIAAFDKSGRFSYKMTPGIENMPIWAQNPFALYYDTIPTRVSYAAGEGACSVERWAQQERLFTCTSTDPSMIRIATLYYPGWEASIDGKHVPALVEKHSGLILLNVPKGKHVVTLRFLNTSIRNIAQWCSAASLLSVAILALALCKKEF